jgi:hypothetical protein
VLVAVATLAAVFAYHWSPTRSLAPSMQPAPSVRQGDPTALNTEFAQLEASVRAKLGLVVSAVGDGQRPMMLGSWQEGPAWSTIKVPLVIAAYRQARQLSDAMKAAITESDNAAAEKLWTQLGDPATAAGRVQQILQETGDPTVVESRKVRTEFTAFGQTIWSLTNQVRFIASAACRSANDPIFALMGHVEANQSWGIGGIAGTQFKGGWGPSPTGSYLVRQIGVLTTPTGKIAVAIAAEPASGTFDDGTHALNELTTWLRNHLGVLPVGRCDAA